MGMIYQALQLKAVKITPPQPLGDFVGSATIVKAKNLPRV